MPLVIILLTAGLILSYKIDKPFWGHHDFNNVFYGNMARNLLRFPLASSKLGQIVFVDLPKPADVPTQFHTHHPPLLIWLLAISYGFLGISEVSTRLVAVIFSLLTLIFFYRIVNRLLGRGVAIVALLFWIITPIFIYFGKMAVHEPLIVFFFVFSFDQYLSWQQKNNFRSYLLMLAVLLLGGLTDWAGYYPPVVITLAYLLTERKFSRRLFLVILMPVFSMLLHLFHTKLLTGSLFGGGLAEIFTLRTGDVVGWGEYVKHELVWITAYFTKPILLSSFAGLVLAFLFRKQIVVYIFLFLLFGSLHLILVRQGVYGHDYQIYYLLPFICLSAAYFIKVVIDLNGKTGGIIFLSIILLSLKLSLPFAKELVEGDRYRKSVELGKYINAHSQSGEKILIDTSEYNGELDGWTISYYADRVNVPTKSHDFSRFDEVFKIDSGGRIEY